MTSRPEESHKAEEAQYAAWKAAKREKDAPYDIERWYDALQPLTFSTSFVDLPVEAAEALRTVYGHRFLSRCAPTTDELRCLSTLRSSLQEAMSSLGGGAGFFVRLSGRSPKDAAMPTVEAYERELATRRGDAGAPGSDAATNTALRAYFEASTQALRVADAAAALELLVCSERISRDLHEAHRMRHT